VEPPLISNVFVGRKGVSADTALRVERYRKFQRMISSCASRDLPAAMGRMVVSGLIMVVDGWFCLESAIKANAIGG